MSGKVFLTKTDARGYLESVRGRRCVCVYSSKSRLATEKVLLVDEILFIDFKDLAMWIASDFSTDHTRDTLVVLGFSDMIRPSNRCDRRFAYLFSEGRYAVRHVIDTLPYRKERWRVWYSYGLVVPNLFGYPHSYAIETAYRNWDEGRTKDDPVSIERLIPLLAPHTRIDYVSYFETFPRYEVVPATDGQKEEYLKKKSLLFKTKSSPSYIVHCLSEYCQAICPSRTMPVNVEILYDGIPDTIVMTDLRVDLYLKFELDRLIKETNALTQGLHEKQDVSK